MAKSDRDISEWDARLKAQLERSFHNYHKRRIDLSVARDNKQLDWTGETIIVEKASSAAASAKVRLNFDDADELELVQNVEIKSIFGRLYLTNDAQADEWLDVIAGINFEYSLRKGQLGINEIQVQWAGADSVSIAGPGEGFSDAFAFSTKASSGHIQLKAHNEGVPAAGDTIDFFLLLTCGDPDGAGADEYDGPSFAIPLGTLDTFIMATAIRTVNCPIVKGGKILAVNNSAGRAITVSACILEKTVS
ncbi:hypothetical protein ES705_15389 [subsurface metagenome]